MEYTLILLKDGRDILVSDEEIKPKDKVYWFDSDEETKIPDEILIVKSITDSLVSLGIEEPFDAYLNECKKIIAGVFYLPTLTYSDEVKEFLKTNYGWVDLDEFLEIETNKIKFINPRERVAYFNGLKFGFKAHQSITNKRFSLEDARKIFYQGHKSGLSSEGSLTFEQTIQSLKQPTQLKVEVDMDWYNPKTNQYANSLPEITGLYDNDGCYLVPKVDKATNSIYIKKIL